MGLLLLLLVILLAFGGLPVWPYAASWGYGPSSFLGLVVIVIVILLLLGRL